MQYTYVYCFEVYAKTWHRMTEAALFYMLKKKIFCVLSKVAVMLLLLIHWLLLLPLFVGFLCLVLVFLVCNHLAE